MRQLIIILFTLIFSFSIKAQKVEDEFFECNLYMNEQAEFKGGMNGLKKFIEKNLKYPPNNICVSGKVYIQFIVEKDGKITHPKILKSLAKEFDEEAMRVVRLMPKWIPARDYGGKKPIASRFTIPINFTLQD
jgi:periplasmic protein TonB